MREKMKKLENVLMFLQAPKSIVKSEWSFADRYVLSENNLKMYITPFYLEGKVKIGVIDKLNHRLYAPIELDTEQELEEFIDIMSEYVYCDFSLFELMQFIYKKFTTEKPLTNEQIKAILRNYIKAFAFQKDGDEE